MSVVFVTFVNYALQKIFCDLSFQQLWFSGPEFLRFRRGDELPATVISSSVSIFHREVSESRNLRSLYTHQSLHSRRLAKIHKFDWFKMIRECDQFSRVFQHFIILVFHHLVLKTVSVQSNDYSQNDKLQYQYRVILL